MDWFKCLFGFHYFRCGDGCFDETVHTMCFRCQKPNPNYFLTTMRATKDGAKDE